MVRIFRSLVVLFIFSLCSYGIGKSQNHYIQELTNTDKVVLLDKQFDKRNGILAKIFDDTVFVIYNYPVMTGKGKAFCFYKIADNKIKYYLELDTSFIHKRDWITDFYINDDTLVLLLFNKIVVYQFNNHDFKIIKKIKLRKPAHIIDYYDGEYILCYTGILRTSNGSIKEYTHKITFDRNFSQSRIKKYPHPHGLQWTLIRPRKLISYKKGYLLISDADRYHFKIYDANDNIMIDTILPNRIIKARSSNQQSSNIGINDLLEKVQTETLIRTVDFIDTNKLLISWTSKNDEPNKMYDIWFDVWERESTVWHLKYDSLQNFIPKKNEDFRYNHEFIDRYWISGTKLITVNPLPFYVNKGYSSAQVDSLTSKYFLKNGARYSLIIREFSK